MYLKIEIIHDTGKIDNKNNEPVFDVVKTYENIKDRKEAEKKVRSWKKSNPGKKFYYRIVNAYGVVHSDGTVTKSDELFGFYDVVDCLMRSWIAPYKAEIRKLKKEMRRGDTSEMIHKLSRKVGRIRKFMNCKVVKISIKAFDKTKDFICYWFWDKWANMISGWKFERKRIKYFKKNGHDITEPWGLCDHLLRDLKWNLKRLKEESVGYPTQFLEEVVRNNHKNDPSFDFDSAWSSGECTNPKVEKEALKLRDKTYDQICHEIDLYMFYSDIGNATEDYELTKDMKYFYFPETYKEIDWNKMSQKRKVHWDAIWDFVKKYGEGMWD